MKERLDVLLVKRGLASSREKAKSAVKAGAVYAEGKKADRAGALYEADTAYIEVRSAPLRYVSRGGLKLEKALECFQISLTGCVCLDIGASTGGFTDCMLQNGAARVYAVDVGHGQLAGGLREDPRVISMEGVNFRYMTGEEISERIGFASADVSFISLTRILGPARTFLEPGGRMVCLVKPQFEAGRGYVGKKGVVRDPAVHRRVLEEVCDFAERLGFCVLGLTFSPVRGAEGNTEYLLCLEKKGSEEEDGDPAAAKREGTGILPASEREEEQVGTGAACSGFARKMERKALIGRTVEEAYRALKQGVAGEPI